MKNVKLDESIQETYSKYIMPVREIEHSFRVAALCLKIGGELNLSKKQLLILHESALYHDIGKADIPLAILSKKGKLNSDEFEIIKNHPIYSQRYVKNNKKISKIVRAHHERWDGKGYPDKIRGKNIPLLARIISVADVYDALKYPRVYRPYSFDKKDIGKIMAKGSGNQFDPEILKVFLEILKYL
ncbi:HD-GYP domain-containing protein [Clostridiisalibacter paucivorans]|uniref:HD-GYP domain-containing protein n=1 Tax=Clostridiisalibacter paucivorans TaxID=408753 RepID=UPI0006877505|nr:HD domain-containing phosphohydrolase [Clostridiisalibacter paucivorans]